MMKRILVIMAFLATAGVAEVASNSSSGPSLPPAIGEEGYKVLTAFYEYDAGIPLDAQVVDLKDEEDTVRRKVVFRGTRGFLVPGYLEFPKKASPPYPCVLLMHGWSGSKEHWWDEDNFISGGNARDALLKKGYAVFALDAQGHGDRIAENDYHVVNLYNEPGTPPRKNYFTVREVISQTVVDYRRGLDYLATRGDIDMQRVGILGYSMGGFQSLALMAMEPRIKVAVGCVVPACWSQDLVLAPANYVRGIAGRPYCMLMGKEDELCSEAQAKELYGMLEKPNTQLVLYSAGHRLPSSYVKDAVEFLEEGL